MNHWVKRALQGGILAGGLWVIGAGIASADTVSDAGSLVSDITSISAPAAPVSDTSLANLVDNVAGSVGTTDPASLDGASADAPANTPIAVTGNSVAIGQPIGAASTSSGASSTDGAPPATGSNSAPTGDATVNAPANAPATVCGNGVGVFAEPGAATCPANGGATAASTAAGGTDTGSGLLGTGLFGNSGLLRSFSAFAPANAPATVCGNTVGIGSSPSSGCPTGTGAGGTDATGDPGGDPGAFAPVNTPATVCGNGIGLFGSGGASCGGVEAATATLSPASPSGPRSATIPAISTGSSSSTGSNPVARLLSETAESLASTGADIRSVLAIALALLNLGTTLALATRRTSTLVS